MQIRWVRDDTLDMGTHSVTDLGFTMRAGKRRRPERCARRASKREKKSDVFSTCGEVEEEARFDWLFRREELCDQWSRLGLCGLVCNWASASAFIREHRAVSNVYEFSSFKSVLVSYVRQ